MKAPHRPALRYFGGSWRFAPRIIGCFPPHDCYVEPFAGAASVMMRKRPSTFEYYNDADGRVVNFFRVLRDRSEKFTRAVSLTPFSREELELSRQASPDPVEDARRFYVLMLQGRGGHESSTGWRYQRTKRARNKSALRDFTDLSHLPAVVARLREVGIEHDDAFAILRRFDGPATLFFVDPPFLETTRSKSSGRYRTEMKTPGEHRLLLALLAELEAYVVLLHPRCELYAEALGAWTRMTLPHLTGNSKRTEVSLWLNPRCAAAQQQQELFATQERMA